MRAKRIHRFAQSQGPEELSHWAARPVWPSTAGNQLQARCAQGAIQPVTTRCTPPRQGQKVRVRKSENLQENRELNNKKKNLHLANLMEPHVTQVEENIHLPGRKQWLGVQRACPLRPYMEAVPGELAADASEGEPLHRLGVDDHGGPPTPLSSPEPSPASPASLSCFFTGYLVSGPPDNLGRKRLV